MGKDVVVERMRKLGKVAPKPVDEWGAEEWQIAYNILTAKYEKLRDKMRLALNTLSAAI
jgi:hypothetical protein